MNSFPTSLVLLLTFGLVAIGLIVAFGGRRFLFQRNVKEGRAALARNDHRVAFQSLCKAERLWDYNPNTHSNKSHREDLEGLRTILDGIERSAQAVGMSVDVEEYRMAVDAVHREFLTTDDRPRSERARHYASTFMQLKAAQSSFRRQLRGRQVTTIR